MCMEGDPKFIMVGPWLVCPFRELATLFVNCWLIWARDDIGSKCDTLGLLLVFSPVEVAVGVWGLEIWKRHPSEGVGGNLVPTSIDVGVLGPDTFACGRSGVGPGKPLSIVVELTVGMLASSKPTISSRLSGPRKLSNAGGVGFGPRPGLRVQLLCFIIAKLFNHCPGLLIAMCNENYD
nr:unnamed protein product [Callosobruchus analis]